jgi:SAM-dependent methyltransferase
LTDRPDWQDWQWDETLFAGAAPHYARGRLPYAPGLAETLAGALELDGRGRLLDCGCGPGTIALLLASRFEAVVGLDPDRGMITEAGSAARRLGIRNASWVRMRAEDLPGNLGRFRAVTFAASFHWMDRPKVARIVRDMLDPGGAAVQIDAPAYRPEELAADGPSLPYPLPPEQRIDELRIRYLGPDRRAGQGIRNTSPSGEDEVFQAAGFAPAETFTVPDGRVLARTADDVVANVFSTSATAPGLFGERFPEFEHDLRAVLADVSPSGKFAVRLPDNRLRVWRPER